MKRIRLFSQKPVYGLLLLTMPIVTEACKKTAGPSTVAAFVEAGVEWAAGGVQLSSITGPAAVVVSREAAVQGVDTGGLPWTFSLIGTSKPGELSGDQHGLQYVDFDPRQAQLLAYRYSLDYTQRAGQPAVFDIWAVLKKPSPSYFQMQKVWLGSADFTSGNQHADMAFSSKPQLKLSAIATGVFTGQWALHYPDAQNYVVQPWQGMCPKTVTQAPGQTPGQNPGQFATCRPLPAKNDLCSGNPTQQSCRPLPPVQAELPTASGPDAVVVLPKTTYGLTVLSSQQAVYSIPAGATAPAKVVFASAKIKPASEAENAAGCADQFYAVARSVDRQMNTSCVLRPAPATMQNGYLTCAVTVAFAQPQTYLEKICNVSAVFRAGSEEVQRIQVLIN